MTSSIQIVIFSLFAIAVCHGRPSSSTNDDTNELLSILSPRSSYDSLVSSLQGSSFSPSSSSSSASAYDDADNDSSSNNRGDNQLPYLSDAMGYSDDPDSDVTDEDDSFNYPIQNGLNSAAMERMVHALLAAARQQSSDMRSNHVITNSVSAEKRYRPSGFMGSRGKRMILPGLDALLWARYYKDAAIWKRQPHSGFHGSRG